MRHAVAAIEKFFDSAFHVLVAASVIAVVFLLVYAESVHAVTRVWDGGGSDAICGAGNGNNWSCGQNWEGDVLPNSSDIVQFSNTSVKDSVVDAGFAGTVLGVQILSGYTGTITQNRSLTVGTGDFSIAGGAYTVAGNNSLDLNRQFLQSGGTFTAPSGDMLIAGNFTQSAGTFLHNNGTMRLDGTGNQTFNINVSLTLSNLTIQKNSGTFMLVTAGDVITVIGALALNDGGLGGTNVVLFAEGDVTVQTTFDGGTGLLDISTNASRVYSMPSGAVLPGLTFSAPNAEFALAGTATTTFEGTVLLEDGIFRANSANVHFANAYTQTGGEYIGGAGYDKVRGTGEPSSRFTVTGGTFDPGTNFFEIGGKVHIVESGFVDTGDALFFNMTNVVADLNVGIGATFIAPRTTLYAGKNFTVGGEFYHSDGTLNFDSCQGTQISGSSTLIVSSLTIDTLTPVCTIAVAAGYAVAVTGTLQLTSGGLSLSGTGGNLKAQGDIYVSNVFGGGNGLITIDGPEDQTFYGNATPVQSDLPEIVINKSVGTLTMGGGAVNSTFRIDGENWTYTQGIVVNASSTLYISSGANLDGEGPGGATMPFDDVVINYGVVTLTGNLDVNGDLTVSSSNRGGIQSTLAAGTNRINLAGNWRPTTSTFTWSPGQIVQFDGEGADQKIFGSSTFYHLVKTVSSTGFLTFPTGSTTVVFGFFNVQGEPGNPLYIRSDSATTQSRIYRAGSDTAQYLDVRDSWNPASTTIVACNSVDSGNNTGWQFTPFCGPPPNTAPVLSAFDSELAFDGTGFVDVGFTVDDADDDVIRVKVEYAPGRCETYSGQELTTLSNTVVADYGGGSITIDNNDPAGYQIGNVPTDGAPNKVTLIWQSKDDVPAANGNYCVFFTANDQTADSNRISGYFTLDNLSPAVPGNLGIGTIDPTQARLCFDTQSSDTHFSEYRLYYKQGASGVTQNDTPHTSANDPNLGFVNYNNATSTLLTGLSASTQYVANIWAYDTYGNSSVATIERVFSTVAMGALRRMKNLPNVAFRPAAWAAMQASARSADRSARSGGRP